MATTDSRPLDWTEVQHDPHGVFARHRKESWYAPIAGTPMVEVLSYEDVRTLLAADDRLLEYLGGHLDDMLAGNPNLLPELREAMRARASLSLINMDGAPHHRLRAAVNRAFTPRSIAALHPHLTKLASELADGLQPGDDFVARFAQPFVARALCAFMGIPEADHERYATWIDVLQAQLSPVDLGRMSTDEQVSVLRAHRELDRYTHDLVAERRAEPQDDFVSRLAADEEAFPPDMVAGLVSDLIFAGNDTTRKGLGGMLLAMVDEPEAWERVAREPAVAEHVVEEVLRLHSPAPGPVRRACTAFEHRGTAIPEGQIAALSIWSANRDESFWGANANALDPERPDASHHLSFGHGPHFCLGASLAREEMRAALVALSQRFSNLRVVGTPAFPPVGSIYGPLMFKLDFEHRTNA